MCVSASTTACMPSTSPSRQCRARWAAPSTRTRYLTPTVTSRLPTMPRRLKSRLHSPRPTSASPYVSSRVSTKTARCSSHARTSSAAPPTRRTATTTTTSWYTVWPTPICSRPSSSATLAAATCPLQYR